MKVLSPSFPSLYLFISFPFSPPLSFSLQKGRMWECMCMWEKVYRSIQAPNGKLDDGENR